MNSNELLIAILLTAFTMTFKRIKLIANLMLNAILAKWILSIVNIQIEFIPIKDWKIESMNEYLSSPLIYPFWLSFGIAWLSFDFALKETTKWLCSRFVILPIQKKVNIFFIIKKNEITFKGFFIQTMITISKWLNAKPKDFNQLLSLDFDEYFNQIFAVFRYILKFFICLKVLDFTISTQSYFLVIFVLAFILIMLIGISIYISIQERINLLINDELNRDK
jgi:hypothetical protein